jgi:hypothetical protein
MQYIEIIAVCSQIHTEHINTAVWAERGIVNVKPAVHKATSTLYTANNYTNSMAEMALLEDLTINPVS